MALDINASGAKQGDDAKAGEYACDDGDGCFPEWDGMFWKAVVYERSEFIVERELRT